MPGEPRRLGIAGNRVASEAPWRNWYWFEVPGSDVGHGAVVPELSAAGNRAHPSTAWELVDEQRVSAIQKMHIYDLVEKGPILRGRSAGRQLFCSAQEPAEF